MHDIALPSAHASVTPVLDSIVAFGFLTALRSLPTSSHLIHHLLYQLAFLCRYRSMIQGWLEVLVIAFSALLWLSVLNMLRYLNPGVTI
jgi:hypothetical protein